MNYNKTSSALIFLTLSLIVLGVVNLVGVYHVVNSLQGDAKAINLFGVIRGGSQRIAKLNIDNGANSVTPEMMNIIRRIDQDFVYLNEYSKTGFHQYSDQFGGKQIEALERSWEQFKDLLSNHDQLSSEQAANALLNKSEDIWHLADKTVFMAQVNSEHKISKINRFYILIFMSIVGALMLLFILFRKVRNRLEYAAHFDSLTGLLNRSCYVDEIEKHVFSSARYQRELALIIFDIDNFKQINDSFGHCTGDSVLLAAGKAVKARLRKSDYLFRIGGDEFAIICPETALEEALTLANNIRTQIANISFEAHVELSLSFGVAEYDRIGNALSLYKEADEALALAKISGKNAVKGYQKSPANNLHLVVDS